MAPLAPRMSLAERVYDAIMDEICDGTLDAGTHIVQEQIAARLDVSRQPVQQAMALLKAEGMLADVGRRGLQVTPLNLDLMRHHYDVRAVLDGLAAQRAAEAAANLAAAKSIKARGNAILRRGAAAVAAGDTAEQIRQDAAFHALFYDLSGNPLLATTAAPHWRFLRRAMSGVLRHAETPEEIWRQHGDILDAVIAGQAEEASRLAIAHCRTAAKKLGIARARGSDATRAATQDGRKA